MARTLRSVQRSATAAPPAAKIPTDPLKALQADWGKKESPYNLKGAGTGGNKDMLQLWAGISIPKNGPPVPDAKLEITAKPTDVVHDKPESNPLKALLADWGKTDSPFDLNGDGTVGIQDLLQLLAGMSIPKDDPPETDPLAALLADWGKTDSPFDLNGDGTVGIQDMLQLLAQMSIPKNDPPPSHPDSLVTPPPITPGDIVDPAGIALDVADTTAPVAVADGATDPSPAKTPLELLLEDWGKAGSPFDLNRDGNVGIRDMLMLLARMTNTKPSSGGVDRLDPEDYSDGRRKSAVAANYHRAAAQNIARTMASKMSTMQPGELRESIQGSNLPELQKRFVLDQIAAWHPHGHSVSLVG